MIDLVMYLLLGVALGTVGGLFGIGGGLIAIPVLGVWFGLDQQIARHCSGDGGAQCDAGLVALSPAQSH